MVKIDYEKAKENVMKLLFMKKTMKEVSYIIASYLLKHYTFLTLKTNDLMFVYKDGIYVDEGEAVVKEEVQKILEGLNSTHTTNEVIGHIKRTTYVDRDKFVEPIDKICLENGVLDIEKMEITPHNSELIFLNKINANYKPDVDCPLIKKFVSGVVGEKDVDIIQEMFGYCLLKSCKFQKAFMFVGNGDNGKSVMISLLENFLGEINTSSITLQKLEYDKFAIANLFGKLANMCADLPSLALGSTENFKKLTAGDRIEGERKFQGSFYFKNYAKIINSANRLPEVTDESYAFFKRWVIINFPHIFTIGKKGTDVNLIYKITTREELDGCLVWAINGLKRLLKNGRFSGYLEIEDIKEEYLRKSSSVAGFEMDCIVYDWGDFIAKVDLYEGYEKYCENENLPIESRTKFYKKFAERCRVVDYAWKSKKEEQEVIHCWRGIGWRDCKLTRVYGIIGKKEVINGR